MAMAVEIRKREKIMKDNDEESGARM